MIGYVTGRIVKVLDNGILLDHNGMGFIIYTSMTTLAELDRSDDVTVYTYMHVKEDAMELYGFTSMDERELFVKLISVSGVGPKGAINIMSNGSADMIKAAIVSGDEGAIKATGVGKKTIQKIILELKDKLIKEGVQADSLPVDDMSEELMSYKSDAILALISLGYDKQSATKAVGKVNVTEDMSAEDILKAALKAIM